MMKLLVIYNPQAGNGRAKALMPKVSGYLSECGFDFDIQVTEHTGHATEITKQVDLSQYDGVIASGGDGTLFEVINGYYQNPIIDLPAGKRPPIGLIPNGTGNAFMKELALGKGDWKRAVEIIQQGQSRELDVGHFKCQGMTYHFLNMVGMGFVTDVAEAATPLKWMGNAAYTAATLLKLISLKSQKFELTIDNKTIQREGIFAEVANSTFTGTTFLMAPKAKLDDGKLDLVFLNKISRLKLLRLFTSIYDGSHVNYPEVEYFQASKISIVEEKSGKLIPDGEVLGETPVEFSCLHRDIRFFWPAG